MASQEKKQAERDYQGIDNTQDQENQEAMIRILKRDTTEFEYNLKFDTIQPEE